MTHDEKEKDRGEGSTDRLVWILVDHSSREAALVPVARELEEEGVEVELVTISEVLGSVAREALAGGAERILRGLRVATRGRAGDEDLIGAFRRRQPDVLVVTEPRFVRSLGVLENLTGVASLQVGIASDLRLDEGWANGQLDVLIVADEQAREAALRQGMSDEQVLLGGPAVRPAFQGELDREKYRDEMGLAEDLVVLVRADGIEPQTLEKLVFQCTLADKKARFVFHYDGDGSTSSTLRRAADQYGLPAAMFGRVPDLERYVAAADAVVAADSDPYLAELLQVGTPQLFVPSGRVSRGNGEVLAGRGLAENLDDLGQLGTRLDRFLADESLAEFREELKNWDGAGRHDALVNSLGDVVRRAEEYREAARAAAPVERTEEEKTEEGPELKGPFETIGRSRPAPSESSRSDGERAPAPRERDFRGISRAEAKEQLAELILKEREQERELREIEKQQERWRGRLQLAREWKEEDLAEEAEGILRGYLEEAGPIEESLQEIRIQKEKLKSAARGESDGRGPARHDDGGGSDRGGRLEERFQKMEVDRDLKGLRDRMKRELGE